MLKPRVNRDVGWLAQSRTTKTLLQQLLVTYPLGTQRVTYLIPHYIVLFWNLTHIRELLLMVDSNLLLITPIPYLILSVLTLLLYKALLASLLGIIGSIDGHNIVLNLTKLFSICARIRESLSNIVVKNIKGMSLLRPRLLKLKVSNRNLLRIEKLTLTQLLLLVYMH